MDIIIASNIESSIIESLADGPGIRLVLFTCGCPHHCKGCHNAKSWNINNGIKVTTKELADYIVHKFKEGYFSGLTFSGGDPFFQADALNELLKLIRQKINNIDIWCYTGYRYEDVCDKEAIKLVNTLVDGPFMEDKQFPRKKFRGSINQRILHLKNGEIISEE